jgi:Tfp pilus tip-associated adhesin PilY1
MSTSNQEKFFAVADDNRTAIYGISDLTNLHPDKAYDWKKPGWYLLLGGTGEKMLSNPAVFGGMVLFTTYTPSPTGNLCAQGGRKLYVI